MKNKQIVEGQRLTWLGHIERPDDKNEVKKTLIWKPLRNRPRETTYKKKWLDDVLKHLVTMKGANWGKKTFSGIALERNSTAVQDPSWAVGRPKKKIVTVYFSFSTKSNLPLSSKIINSGCIRR